MDGLKFVIKRQWITRIDNFKPVAKSKNYLYAKFVFSSDEWTGIKTALFASSNTERPVPMLLDENGVCKVPHEVLDWDGEGDFTVSVFCGDLITANKANVHVYETGYTDDAGQEHPPTPSIYAQILARLHGVENLEVYAETLPEGSEASVEKSVDPETEGYVFNFGIPKGDKGDTGFAPRVTVEDITGGHRITIEDATQTYVFNVMDGTNGEDGYSPTIVVGDITGGHRVIITDKNGEHIFNVMDGQNYVLTQADKEEIAAMVDLSDYAKKTDLDGKVDKVTGKGLSTNDYTTEEKSKLSGIEAGAKANVQSDWNQTDASADDYIKNKPEIPSAVTVDDELSDESENPVQNKVIDAEIGDLKAEINQLQNDKADIIFSNASGAIASFTDGADGMPMESVVAHIEPVQAEGTPSPENPLPISGWTQANVARVGKNLLPNIKYLTSNKRNIILGSNMSYGQPKTYLKANVNYTLQVVGTQLFTVYLRDVDNVATRIGGGYDTSFVITFTVSKSGYYAVYAYTSSSSSYDEFVSVDSIEWFQLEVGSIATEYEPYQGETFTIDLDGTVYGGTVDLVSGKLVVDRAYVDLGQLNYTRTSGSDNVFVFTTAGFVGKKTGVTNIIADCLQTTSITAWSTAKPNNSICGSATSTTVVIRADDYTTVADLKTALSNRLAVYELATPIIYDLTPQEITSLLGVNNVWSNTGDTDVTYRADTKLYLESHMPEVNVEDVQVNGTSIVDAQGVANVPIASSSAYGAVRLGVGLRTDSGNLVLDRPTSEQVKSGVNGYRAITPNNQHESTFYGLAKAAGSDEKNSSLAVGQYTDAAKIAIQKMLGIYEAPWELIRNDTVAFSEAGALEITVDNNGQPFQLTDVIFEIQSLISESQTVVEDLGRAYIYYSSSSRDIIYLGAYTVAAGGTGKCGMFLIEQRNGIIERKMLPFYSVNSVVTLQTRNRPDMGNSSWLEFGNKTYTKLRMDSLLGTFEYKLYGKRKWS